MMMMPMMVMMMMVMMMMLVKLCHKRKTEKQESTNTIHSLPSFSLFHLIFFLVVLSSSFLFLYRGTVGMFLRVVFIFVLRRSTNHSQTSRNQTCNLLHCANKWAFVSVRVYVYACVYVCVCVCVCVCRFPFFLVLKIQTTYHDICMTL
jgi:hypothetical protein